MLIGREAECTRIAALLSQARGGSSAVLLVRGEPGIGKTALLQHAAERAGMPILTARGVEFEAEIPFAGLLELVRPALSCLEQVPALQAAALRGALALGPAVPGDRFVVGAATLSLLAAYAEQSPCLVVIDDAQWLDRSSADALLFALRRLLADRIAVLLAVRDGEGSVFDAAGLPELRLVGLDSSSARLLLQRDGGDRVAPDVAEWLHRATGGNPLALVELADDAPRLEVELFDRPLVVGPRIEQRFARQIARLSSPARRALAIAAASDSGALHQLALGSVASDRWSAALAEYAEGIRLGRETGQDTDLCGCLAGLSRLEAHLGRDDASLAHAAQARELATRLGLGLFRIWTYLTQAELGLLRGQLRDAVRRAQDAARIIAELGIKDPDVSPAPELVEAYLRLGQGAEALAVADEFARWAEDKDVAWSLARAARCRGLLADETTYEEHFSRALRYHDRTPDSFERGRTHLCFGERLRRSRRRVEARGHLRTAFEAFERLGADPWVERARVELLATGETAHRRGAGALERLTPQEFQIAQMLAAGATTREAAGRLFLSPKTVEYHLRSVYGKLGIASRAALATAVVSLTP